MFTLIAFIVAGLFIAAAIALTFRAWRNKLNEKRRIANARKVVSAEIGALAKNCTHRKSFDEINRLKESGYTHVMAAMDSGGDIVGDVEVIKDSAHDSQVSSMHGSEGVIVVED